MERLVGMGGRVQFLDALNQAVGVAHKGAERLTLNVVTG